MTIARPIPVKTGQGIAITDFLRAEPSMPGANETRGLREMYQQAHKINLSNLAVLEREKVAKSSKYNIPVEGWKSCVISLESTKRLQ